MDVSFQPMFDNNAFFKSLIVHNCIERVPSVTVGISITVCVCFTSVHHAERAVVG